MTEGRRQGSGIKKKENDSCLLIPAPRSLKHRSEFLIAAQRGKKWVTQSFILQFHPSPVSESSGIRYGLTASGKIGNAVIRNRARRRLRALAHEILPLHAMPGHDYILIARAATVTREYADLKKDLLWALKKLGALKGT